MELEKKTRKIFEKLVEGSSSELGKNLEESKRNLARNLKGTVEKSEKIWKRNLKDPILLRLSSSFF